MLSDVITQFAVLPFKYLVGFKCWVFDIDEDLAHFREISGKRGIFSNSPLFHYL